MAIHKVDLVIPADTPEDRPFEIEVGNIKRIAHLGIRLPSENEVSLQFSVMDTPVYPSQGWLHTFQWHIIHLEEPIGFDVPYRLRIRAMNPSPKESLCVAVLGEIDETPEAFQAYINRLE